MHPDHPENPAQSCSTSEHDYTGWNKINRIKTQRMHPDHPENVLNKIIQDCTRLYKIVQDEHDGTRWTGWNKMDRIKLNACILIILRILHNPVQYLNTIMQDGTRFTGLKLTHAS